MNKLLSLLMLISLLISGCFLTKDKPLAYVSKRDKEAWPNLVWDAEYNKHLQEPIDVAIWGKYIFVTDIAKKAVIQVDAKTGRAETLAATELKFQYPYGLLVVEDVLYISDCANKTIQAYNLATQEAIGVVYSGTDGTKPGFMGVDEDKNLWVSDLQFKRILKLNREGLLLESVGEGQFVHPQGIAFLNGRILVADEYQGSIYSINPDTKELSKFLEIPGQLSLIRDLAAEGNFLYAIRPLAGTVAIYDLTGRFLVEHQIATLEGAKGIPMGVTPLPQGGALVVDRANGCLQPVLP